MPHAERPAAGSQHWAVWCRGTGGPRSSAAWSRGTHGHLSGAELSDQQTCELADRNRVGWRRRFAPVGGSGTFGMVYGAVIGTAQAAGVNDEDSLANATQQLAQQISQQNGGLRQISQIQTLNLNGQLADALELSVLFPGSDAPPGCYDGPITGSRSAGHACQRPGTDTLTGHRPSHTSRPRAMRSLGSPDTSASLLMGKTGSNLLYSPDRPTLVHLPFLSNEGRRNPSHNQDVRVRRLFANQRCDHASNPAQLDMDREVGGRAPHVADPKR